MKKPTRHEEMRDQVIAFSKDNPQVMVLFSKFTFDRINRGFKNYSVNAIFERIRWETDQADHDGISTFKLNNNHRPFYARAWMKINPEHNGFFRTRKQTSKDEPETNLPPLGPGHFDGQQERVHVQ